MGLVWFFVGFIAGGVFGSMLMCIAVAAGKDRDRDEGEQ